ncbi:ABC transporter ATP-binding protein [Paenibacillus sp. 481]|uniref:ABC transporter ATP-binding protein n=1 Tax=Paenibacillus sp. 481 TaxID=2835869 RepID=UPI001E65D40D|nr:ABC transporter ATP-binding protein [Paenibacillus sp. 481]UHA75303.1 ABC transporter ATP-binding protein [Paenibacillus sp. 481]
MGKSDKLPYPEGSVALLEAENIEYARESGAGGFRLDRIRLSVERGEAISIIGPNGSGKSTLLRVLARLLQPNGGAVYLSGKPLSQLPSNHIAEQLAMVQQAPPMDVQLTVEELVHFGRRPYRRFAMRQAEQDADIVRWAMEAMRVERMAQRQLHTLSGGERQRAWLAMALAQQPRLLLLDEPTTYLDIAHQLELMEHVRMLHRKHGIAIIMVLHDINQAAQYTDRLVVMKAGRVVADGPPRQLFSPELFRDVFQIEAIVHEQGGYPCITPLRCVRADESPVEQRP